MAVFKTVRYQVRSGAGPDAERAMREFAAYVRRDLPDSSWTMYRDPHDPTHYLALIRADDRAADARHRDAPGTQAFVAALAPVLAAELEVREYELVTSSDLAPRHRPGRRPAARRRRSR